MTDLKLEVGEGILLQTTDAGRYDGKNEISIDELYLTNRYLICVYEKSTGIFKSETVTEKIPLSSIAIINGVVQIQQVDDDDYGKSLQIIYTSGKRELLELNVSPKKQYPVWKTAISDAVMSLATGALEPQQVVAPPVTPVQQQEVVPPPVPTPSVATVVPDEPKAGKTFAGATLFAGFKSVMDTAKQTFSEVAQTVTEKVPGAGAPTQPIEEPAPVMDIPPIPTTYEEKKEGKVMFCSNCGTKLNEGARFCHGCGSAVGAAPAPVVPEPPVQPKANSQERQQEYVGKVLKCPHCGNPITERDVLCPTCGMEITGRAAVTSVQAFKEQLMAIENTRKGGLGGLLGVYTAANKADVQKLSLIRNFPIPNSIDDILEFIMLAIANIDVSLSKNTMMNRMNNTQTFESGATIGRTISNAWVSKMQQAYQKAEIMFPDAPAFKGIQKLYFDKMKELKIKVK